MIGTQAMCRSCRLLLEAVEERSNRVEAVRATGGGPVGSENPDISNDKHGENPCRRKDKVS